MKNSKKEIAIKRMKVLFNIALLNARNNPEIAQKQALIIKGISMKFKIAMPPEIRSSFCKKCKKFIVPNISSRVRFGKGNEKSICITCNFCNHVYRKIIKN